MLASLFPQFPFPHQVAYLLEQPVAVRGDHYTDSCSNQAAKRRSHLSLCRRVQMGFRFFDNECIASMDAIAQEQDDRSEL